MFGVAGRHARRRASLASITYAGGLQAKKAGSSRFTPTGSITSLRKGSVSSPVTRSISGSPQRRASLSPALTGVRQSILLKLENGQREGIAEQDEEEDEEGESGKGDSPPEGRGETDLKNKEKQETIKKENDEERESQRSENDENNKVSNKDGKESLESDDGEGRSAKTTEGSEYSSTRRLVRLSVPDPPNLSAFRQRNIPSPACGYVARRRRAVGLGDHKSCAIVQKNMKLGLGDIM